MTKSDNEKTKSVLQSATDHFKDKISGKLYKLRVDEWKCDIHYKATASMRTESKIMSLTQDGKTAEALVESIILKSFDENGDRIFKESDRATLLNEADPKVLIRVATTLNNVSDTSLGEVEKNS
jgi:hypothetical protein